MKNAHELKALQVRSNQLILTIDSLTQEKQKMDKEIAHKKNELKQLVEKINNFTKSSPIVTEHAMLRYIERVMGVDLEKITNDILTEQNIKTIEFAGSCRIKSNSVEFIVKDRKVISVIT